MSMFKSRQTKGFLRFSHNGLWNCGLTMNKALLVIDDQKGCHWRHVEDGQTMLHWYNNFWCCTYNTTVLKVFLITKSGTLCTCNNIVILCVNNVKFSCNIELKLGILSNCITIIIYYSYNTIHLMLFDSGLFQ